MFTHLKNQAVSIPAQNKFKESLENNPEEAIESLAKGMADRHGQLSIYYLNDDADAYLTFNNVFIEKKGEGKRRETTVVHALRIPPGQAQELMEKYKTERNYFLEH